MDRRTLLAGGVALAAASAVRAAPIDTKEAAIEAIDLPPSFGGAIAYAQGGRVRHVRTAGFADREAQLPVTATTQFKWGSASKWVTSVAALRLVEQRRLSLTAPIATYLPSFRADTGARVTLAHLLSNTSGIPDLLTRQLPAEPALRTSPAAAAEMVARFGAGDLAFPPGAGWDYAALNWVIVAALLQQVTGEALPALAKRLVLDPAGARTAGFVQADQPPLRSFAAAYDASVPPARKMASVPPFLAASGNIAGSVADAARIAHAVFHGRLLGDMGRRELTTLRWPAQEYALGGRVHRIDGDPWAWETGKVQGYRALIAHRLSTSETVVIFNNSDMEQSVIAGWAETIARA